MNRVNGGDCPGNRGIHAIQPTPNPGRIIELADWGLPPHHRLYPPAQRHHTACKSEGHTSRRRQAGLECICSGGSCQWKEPAERARGYASHAAMGCLKLQRYQGWSFAPIVARQIYPALWTL